MTDKFNLLSDEQLDAISSGKLWTFHGGVHPQENKSQSNQYPISDAGIAATLVIPVEHKGHIPELLVKVGDPVLKGQPLTKVYGAMVVHHASSSGTVIAIEKRCDLHPSGLSVLSVVIQTDGLDRTIDYVKPPAYQGVEKALLIEQIQQAGIVGLGGAGFPSHLKLIQHDAIKLLIINAAECEPYITSDDRLMQEQADEIIAGIEVLNHILQPRLTVIAIEDNKTDAIASLQAALQNSPQQDNIILRIIPTIYPSGSAKQLIEIITGQQTPVGKHSIKLGIVMLNVGTVFAIKEAIIDGKPLTSRIVTLTGDSLQKKGNLSVRIGTPIQYLLDRYWVDSTAVKELIIGGPMMGFTVSNTAAPVTKTCNCILAPTIKEMPDARPEMPCIRCSECAHVCPSALLPQQLLWYSKSQEYEKLAQYNLNACMECGACAYVCPSHIPLVEYYRVAKAEISTAKNEAKKAETARLRHENREARLEQAKIDRQAKHKEAAAKRKAQMQEKSGGDDLISAALARAKAKKSEQPTIEIPAQANDAVSAAIARAKAKKAQQSESGEQDPKKAAVAAALARARAKKAAQAGNTTDNAADTASVETPTTAVDPKKAAVAAAIARARAKKAAQAGKTPDNAADTTPVETPTTEVDPKKAAVAAAIARAKAKKAAQAGAASEATTAEDKPAELDPKKAAVAAAIARAKAKKAAQAETSEVVDDKPVEADPRKAAVAAAIARAKAKKAAQAETSEVVDDKPAEADPRKAAVAAAIARAKAKKAEQAQPTVIAQDEPDNSEVIKQREQRKEQARQRKLEKAAAAADSEQSQQPEQSAAELRKAKIAAAVARAKAKKESVAKNSSANEEQK